MIACYDLQRRLPTFDFFGWLASVRMLGATEITFSLGRKFLMRKKWPASETHRRLESILMPGPALAGLPGRMGDDGDHEIGSHEYRYLLHIMTTRRCEMPRLKGVLPPGCCRYTVTLRDLEYKPSRNSDRDLWIKFAAEIGAYVIDDYRHKPMSLHQRMALYAGAEMNFGVPTGPLSMLCWSPYPLCEVVDPEIAAADYLNQGIEVGQQVPWFLPNQRIVWGKPTLELLMQEFRECRRENDRR